MNVNTSSHDSIPSVFLHSNSSDLPLGSEGDFPPLPILYKGGSSSGSKYVINAMANNVNNIAQTVHNAIPEKSVNNSKGNRIPYVNMFRQNKMAKKDYKLDFIEPGEGMIEFGEEHVDSVEKTYGFCLLGYVICGKPPIASLVDLVRRWGSNIKFQTHVSGWILFTFPSVEVKNRILEGVPYMVYGFHMFIKEMPKCFQFREEDMNTIPAWIQIHGLPPDCWNYFVLSRLASLIGKPIHMDMLTHDRKRMKFSRVLVDMDLSIPKLLEVNIKLPIGIISVSFEYEHDFKLCDHCKRPGHSEESCFALKNNGVRNDKRGRGKSKSVRRNRRKSCNHASSSRVSVVTRVPF